MSVRAYRVKKIDYVTPDSFNLWHHDKLMEFFDEKCSFYQYLNADGCGVTDLSVEVLEQAILKAKELDLDEDIVKALKADIEAAKAKSEDWVQYYCF